MEVGAKRTYLNPFVMFLEHNRYQFVKRETSTLLLQVGDLLTTSVLLKMDDSLRRMFQKSGNLRRFDDGWSS